MILPIIRLVTRCSAQLADNFGQRFSGNDADVSYELDAQWFWHTHTN